MTWTADEAFKIIVLLSGARWDRERDEWHARCPVHDGDRNPSLLTIAHAEDGRVLLFCPAGCSPESTCRAVGIPKREYIDDFIEQGSRAESRLGKMNGGRP